MKTASIAEARDGVNLPEESEKRKEALNAVVESQGGRLLSVIRKRIRNQVEADDVFQEVFEEFLHAYDLGQAIDTLGAWLVRVAQNKIIDRFRRRKSSDAYRASMASSEVEKKEANRPDEEWTRALLREEIVNALEMLPEEQREVFVKHELEGKSFEEISAETGVGVNTLLSRKRYAVTFLRHHLKEIYDELE